MPSKSYILFLELLEDVYNLNELVYDFDERNEDYGFLSRSAVVMLCACWERYNECLLLECQELILATPISAKDLPKSVQKYISANVKSHKHELFPIEMADTGWRQVWKQLANTATEILNTPNSENLIGLFSKNLGIDYVTNYWHKDDIALINDFVKKRGDIAHQGNQVSSVTILELEDYIDLIINNTIEIDSRICDFMESTFKVKPWEKRYFRSIITQHANLTYTEEE